jgi:DNA-binding PadR family transcriptional regulator
VRWWSCVKRTVPPFSYVILALVGRGGAGPHDIVQMMREGAVFWTTSESHFYAEPKRLAKLGYLTAEKQPGRTRERTHYQLTDTGRQALQSGWPNRPRCLASRTKQPSNCSQPTSPTTTRSSPASPDCTNNSRPATGTSST